MKLKAKILIISDDAERGGAYKVAQDVAIGLDAAFFEYKFVFLREQPTVNPPTGLFIGKPNINVDFSLKSYMRLAFLAKKSEWSYKPLNDVIFDYQPDIIHFHSHPITLILAQGIENLPCRSILVFTDHLQRIRKSKGLSIFAIKQKLMGMIYRKLFLPYHTVFISNLAYQTAKSLSFLKDTDSLIPNTVDVKVFTPKSELSTDLKVIYLARFHPIKAHKDLLEAWQSLSLQKGLSLYLYGAESDGGEIKKIVESTAFPNPVYYGGMTSASDEKLRESSIGVFPSHQEGMPLALLEMMASGLPIVASDIPEIATIITHRHDGLLFKCGNFEDLANKLQIVIDNRTLREELGSNARKTVEEKYAKPLGESYGELYQQLIQSHQ